MIILKYALDRYEGSKKRCDTRLNLYTYIYLSTRVIVNLGPACGLFAPVQRVILIAEKSFEHGASVAKRKA